MKKSTKIISAVLASHGMKFEKIVEVLKQM